ncbi:MAG: DsbA family oxidoreductase [Inhella sp.]
MKPLHIEFVSDIACPWCAIGLHALEAALTSTGVPYVLRFEPFELNPNMPPEGQDAVEHLSAKYGINETQIAQNRQALRERGAALGFEFGDRARVWNTFDAHRVLHAAGEQGPEVQLRLKHLLLEAYHRDGMDPANPELLMDRAELAGLPREMVQEVLQSGRFAAEVREAEGFWQNAGIRAVPAVVINRKHLISGGQPVEAFESALRDIAAG